ncbi:MAG: repeat-containing protein [Bryobacterales bacterium]|nr:repeat-containing protein [Bryobacterales bacterium]
MHPDLSNPSRSLEPVREAPKTHLPQPHEVRAQVQKILESSIFSNCGRLTRFISFAAQHALSGTGAPLKEYVIGVEVFDRTSAYDPRIDPIVRVEARRLRSKLETYYASVGCNDRVLVEFPKGSYAPVFRVRTSSEIRHPDENDPACLALTVLPFSPLTTRGLDDGFAAGLTEDIVHGLTNIQKLRLLPWNTGSNREKIDALLRGSVRYESGRVRVIAQCIEASSQGYVWSEAYDHCGMSLSVQDNIAQAIVARVVLTVAAACGNREGGSNTATPSAAYICR